MVHPRTWLFFISLPVVATLTYQEVSKGTPSSREKLASDPLAGLTDIQDVLNVVQSNYVDPPDMEKVVGGGVQAALERVHVLNSYISPEEMRQADPGPGETGIIFIKRGLYAQVMAVKAGSPAEVAKVQSGDVIRRIDNLSVGSLSQWAIDRKLRGQPGSQVLLHRFSAATGDEGKVTIQRALPVRQSLPAIRKEGETSILALRDLEAGRAQEIQTLLSPLDHSKPLVLDLRQCASGSWEEAAKVAGLFVKQDKCATIQEVGKADQDLKLVPSTGEPFSALAVYQNPSTMGPSELLTSCLKKAGIPIFGERTPGLAVEVNTYPLKTGGAIQMVYRRWMGAGGEKLDRQGVMPTTPIRGLKPGEDPLVRLLEVWKPKR